MSYKSVAPLYRYRALEGHQWIRVLQLWPSDAITDLLQGEIVHVDREKLGLSEGNAVPFYDAVSYAWGEPNFTQQLPCSDGSVLPITPNVEIMLRRLRSQTKTRYLWIDAVCLNQSDRAEIESQVPMMGEIYRQASKVRVWLGKGDPQVRKVFSFFRALAGRNIAPDTQMLQYLMHTCFGHSESTELQEFLHRQWFYRRWIIQEVLLGLDVRVYCHDDSIPWAALLQALKFCRELAEAKLICVDEAAETTLNKMFNLRAGTASILDLLWKFRLCLCSEERDRLFALYGIAEDIVFARQDQGVGKETSIEAFVDYTVDIGDVWSQFARNCARAGWVNHVLLHATAFGSLSKINETAPTWIPNWSNPRRPSIIDELALTDLSMPGDWPIPGGPFESSFGDLEILVSCINIRQAHRQQKMAASWPEIAQQIHDGMEACSPGTLDKLGFWAVIKTLLVASSVVLPKRKAQLVSDVSTSLLQHALQPLMLDYHHMSAKRKDSAERQAEFFSRKDFYQFWHDWMDDELRVCFSLLLMTNYLFFAEIPNTKPWWYSWGLCQAPVAPGAYMYSQLVDLHNAAAILVILRGLSPEKRRSSIGRLMPRKSRPSKQPVVVLEGSALVSMPCGIPYPEFQFATVI